MGWEAAPPPAAVVAAAAVVLAVAATASISLPRLPRLVLEEEEAVASEVSWMVDTVLFEDARPVVSPEADFSRASSCWFAGAEEPPDDADTSSIIDD